MDEFEFRRILEQFPIIRSPAYHAESEASRESSSKSVQNEAVMKEWQNAWDEGDQKEVEIQGISHYDAFWGKLKSAAEMKVGAAEAERFCKAFQRIHRKLVHEELSLDAAQSFINSS